MQNLNDSAKTLQGFLSKRILVLAGAMGTILQWRNPMAVDFGGIRPKV